MNAGSGVYGLMCAVAITAMVGCGHSVSLAQGVIRVNSTVTTNESGSVTTRDVFTRDGHTNLVRTTRTMSGVVQIVLLEAFTATNGVFYPADSSLIRKANDIGRDMSKLLSPSHVTNTPPGEFRREVEQLIQKHTDH